MQSYLPRLAGSNVSVGIRLLSKMAGPLKTALIILVKTSQRHFCAVLESEAQMNIFSLSCMS